jgi:hypothetical protein
MKDHKLSNQAVGAIMMALQKSLMEQSDIRMQQVWSTVQNCSRYE